MGTDINGAISHRAQFPPTESLAKAMCSGIERGPIIYNKWILDPQWDRIYDTNLSVWFGPRAAIISSGYGWPDPGQNISEKQEIISAICAVGRFFQSPRVIFLPDDIEPWCDADDWIAGGITLEELQQRWRRSERPQRISMQPFNTSQILGKLMDM